MKVIVLGATGRLGSRIVPALLAHNHSVVAYVRSADKLKSLLPEAAYSQITIVEGDAKDSAAIKKAILDHNCDGVVQTAGLAALAPWAHSDLPVIFSAVLEAVKAAGAEKGQPLRAWFLAGMGILNYPGTQTLLSTYVPIYLEHRGDLKLLRALPPNTVDWTVLCPAFMVPESESVSFPFQTSLPKLIVNANEPPLWKHSWLEYIPLLGKPMVAGMNASRYDSTLEQHAELIAEDLETRNSPWIGQRVGTIDPTKQ